MNISKYDMIQNIYNFNVPKKSIIHSIGSWVSIQKELYNLNTNIKTYKR